MISINLLRDNPKRVKKAVADRGMGNAVDVDAAVAADEKYRALLQEVEELRRVRNETSEQVGTAKQEGNDEKAEELIEAMQEVKTSLQNLEDDLRTLRDERDRLVGAIPNIPFDEVPVGKDESDNVVVREVGERPAFDFEPKDHLALGEALGVIDTKRAADIAGARFGYLRGDVALMEFALVQLAFQELLPDGFIPMVPPVMARPDVMRGWGKGTFIDNNDAFYLEEDDLYLVGSSEHTIGPFHMGETLPAEDLPIRYLGFSTCFRREAGSYGKDTRGILRVHQFDKVEMLIYATPEQSRDEHEFLIAKQEQIMQKLELPYRVVEICTGDMTFADAKQYDIETWMPGQDAWKETHSGSNTTDFQSRGVNIRSQPQGGEPAYAHMLNATAIAIGRTIVAIMENYQQEDGSIVIPEALRPWMFGRERIALNGGSGS